MKEGIHPEYKETTVNVLAAPSTKLVLLKKISALIFVLNAIRFSPVSRSLLIPADVLTDSRRDIILISNLGKRYFGTAS